MASRRQDKPKQSKDHRQHIEKGSEQSAAKKDCKGQQQANCETHKPCKPEPRRKIWLFRQSDPVAGFTAWIAIFTAILMLISGIQVWAFVQSERAFVYPWTTLSPTALIADKQAIVTMNVQNSGHSGASIIDVNLTYFFSKDPLPEEPAYIEGAQNAVVGPIAQNMVLKAVVPLHDKFGVQQIFNQTNIDTINDGTYKLYVFGWIKYTDDFSLWGPKTTGFCGVYAPGQTTDNTFFNCGRMAYVYTR
jgi:hypothetical protein